MRYSHRHSVMPSTSRPKGPAAMRPPSSDEIMRFTMAAQKAGDIEIVQDFIRRFPKHIDAKDNYGYTALMRAARYKDSGFEILKLLIENGSDVNLKKDNSSALMWAILDKSTKSGELLLYSGVNLDLKTSGGRNFLMTAANFKNMDMIKMLINKGMNPFEKDDDGHDSFYELRYDESDIKEFMFELYEEKNIKTDERLYKLIEDNDINSVREYFDEDFYKNKKVKLKPEYLEPAIINENIDMVRLLLTRGIKFSKKYLNKLEKENEAKYPTYITILRQAGLRGLPKIPKKTESQQNLDLSQTFESQIADLKEKIPQEWSRVLSSLSKEANAEAVIAGGALRDLFNDRAIKDVDIFVRLSPHNSIADEKRFISEAFNNLNIETVERKIKVHKGYNGTSLEFKSTDKIVVSEGDSYGFNRETLKSYVVTSKASGDEYNIVFVGSDFRLANDKDFAAGIIDRFDLGICQIGFDGNDVLYTNSYREDINNKTITLKRSYDSNKEHIKRVMKKYPEWDICNDTKKMFPIKNKFFKKFRVKSSRTNSTGPR